MITSNEAASVAAKCSLQIYQVLRGLPPELQGAILADALSMWLAGHVASDPVTQDEVRETLLTEHIAFVRSLIPVNAAMIAGGMFKNEQ